MEKALKLAATRQKVAFLLCYDTFDPIKDEHADVKEEDHFLFQALKQKFIKSNVQLEFVNIRNVMRRVGELIQEEFHIFADEYSFAGRKYDPKMREEVNQVSNMLDLKKVRRHTRSTPLSKNFTLTLSAIGSANICLVCW